MEILEMTLSSSILEDFFLANEFRISKKNIFFERRKI